MKLLLLLVAPLLSFINGVANAELMELRQKDGRRQLPLGIYRQKRGRLRFWGYLRAGETRPSQKITPDGRAISDDYDGYRFPVKKIRPDAWEIVVDSVTGRAYWVRPEELKEDFRVSLVE